MAFDQNSIPLNLRPINVSRNLTEEPRIAAVTTTTTGRIRDGAFPSSTLEAGSPNSMPVFYPPPVSDGGFLVAGYGNVCPQWAPHMPVPVGQTAVGFKYSPNLGNMVPRNVVNHGCSDVVGGQNLGNQMAGNSGDNQVNSDLVSGIGYIQNSGNRESRNGSSGSDYISEEGGSVSGKKVKFLCSFGGKILPRPYDGALRYVGGQTRIISVRRDVSFNELMQKMVDTYGQPVVIKYQLPDEDLDALVSVSCPDDLDNMMDEYTKLVESSSHGSAKLRVFLFSASELDTSGMVQFGDLHDSGQRYVEAVNGIMEGAVGIGKRGSIASGTSTQNSDISGIEALDIPCAGQGDAVANNMLSSRGNSAISNDSVSKFVSVDPNHAAYAGVSGIPLVKSGPPQIFSSQPEIDTESPAARSVPQPQVGFGLQQPGCNIPHIVPPTQTYMDPRHEVVSRAEFIHLAPQMGFPNSQLLRNAGPIYTQQQFYHDYATGMTSHQFIPAVHATMSHLPSQIGLRPALAQPLMQPQQTRLERYPEETTFTTRVVQLPNDQSYNAYQGQVAPGVVQGGYAWPQVPPQEHVVFSDGSAPRRQDQRDNVASPLSTSSSVYSPRPEDAMRLLATNRIVATGLLREGVPEHVSEMPPRVVAHMDQQIGMPQFEAIRSNHNIETQLNSERSNLLKVDNPDHPNNVSVTHGRLVGEGQPSYGMFVDAVVPQSGQEGGLWQPFGPSQYQIKQETLVNTPVNGEVLHTGGLNNQASERLVGESPKEQYGNFVGSNLKDDLVSSCASHDQLKPVDGIMETLQMLSPEIFVTGEQNKSPVGRIRTDDAFNQSKASEAPCSSADVNYVHYSQPMASYEMAQPSLLGDLGVHQQIQGNQLAYVNDRIPFIAEQKDESMVLHQNIIPNEADLLPAYNTATSSLSPSTGPGDIHDSSNSLFSIQDPWNLGHDTHVPPLKPSKIPINKEAFGTSDPFTEDLLGIYGEQTSARVEEGGQQSSISSSKELNDEHAQSSKGSSDDLVKQELKAVAEGVAASVLQSSISSNHEVPKHERLDSANEAKQETDLSNRGLETPHKAKFEDMKAKLPDKVNVGFPVSDGIGRLQIINNSDLEELKELGSGTFGTVYHGKWRGTDVAIKRINDRCFAGKPSEQERMIDDFWNEAIKLADLHHPNVVAFYGVVLDGPGGTVATVTEYMVNGSLRTALQKNERSLDKRKRLLIAMDVAFGMEYLHGKNIVHFDLKSDNLLVNLRDPQRPICKVGDLGLSKVKCQTLISGGVRGTLPWMAPELLNGSSSLVSDKVDVFSFGIVLWELLTGEEPYADLHYGAIIGGIVSNTLRPEIPISCDPDWKLLMERCWSAEPSERPNFTEIANKLRTMAGKIPQKGQNPSQPAPSTY